MKITAGRFFRIDFHQFNTDLMDDVRGMADGGNLKPEMKSLKTKKKT